MELNLDSGNVRFNVTAYKENSITVSGEVYTNSILIMPSDFLVEWPVKSVSELTLEHFALLLPHHPPLFILGTGNSFEHLDQKILAYLYEQSIGVEVMDTPAACRTYSLLATEGRQFAAGFIIN